MEQYHNALQKELKQFFSHYTPEKLPVSTIYIGGGTPSTYPSHLLLDTFDTLRSATVFSPTIEVSIEVNPGTVVAEQLDVWQEVGINRISIGVQSLNDMVLKRLNRHQSVNDVNTALSDISKRFEVISVDLILGLPGISADEWKKILATVVQWPISHISIYFLMVHENTPLYFGVKTNKITLPCDDEVVDLYFWSIDFLKQHEFYQYEISNFARVGYQSQHNSAYWERKPFKGFGLGACSFDGKVRFQNQKNLMVYIDGEGDEKKIQLSSEELSDKQIRLEKLMLGLRQTKGLVLHELYEYLAQEERVKIFDTISLFEQQGLIINNQGTIRLTPKALAVENEIITKLSL